MNKTLSAALALTAVLVFAPGTASAHRSHHHDQYRGDYFSTHQYSPPWRRCGRGYEFFRGRCYWVGRPQWRDDRHDRRDQRRHAW